MSNQATALILAAGLLLATAGHAADKGAASPPKPALHPDSWTSDGTATIGGKPIAYQAVVGTLIVHPKGWEDDDALPEADHPPAPGSEETGSHSAEAAAPEHGVEASMSYVAYLAKDAAPGRRPITFIYNGGPGSSTIWLHMGAFGPQRVVTADDSYTPAAPYQLVDNDESLLDATDLVFVDAPGTGLGRFVGKDAKKAFWGIDEDGNAFANFVTAFLTRYGKWNAPKYLFGESYGTTRSAVVANILEQDEGINLNGVILLSQVLNFELGPDDADNNPGQDMPYVLALPSYAATALYHHKLGANPPPLDQLLQEVEQFATHDYLQALQAGAALDTATRDAVASKLHDYTGLSLAYLKRANLRVDGGEFEHALQVDTEQTTGRLDTRFSGPVMDPMAKDPAYDPQAAAIAPACVPPLNDYARPPFRDDGVEVERLELFGVIERLAHRIGARRMLIKHFKAELIGPPVAVAATTAATLAHRAFARSVVADFRVHA